MSSGAVSSGKHLLQHFKGTLAERKAAAAIGNPLLISRTNGLLPNTALQWRRHFANGIISATVASFYKWKKQLKHSGKTM